MPDFLKLIEDLKYHSLRCDAVKGTDCEECEYRVNREKKYDCLAGICNQAKEAIEFLQAQNKKLLEGYQELFRNYAWGQQTWINCEDRLPEKGEVVITAIFGTDLIIQEEGETLEEAVKRSNEEPHTTISFLDDDGLWCDAFCGGPEIVTPSYWTTFPNPPENPRKGKKDG